MVMVLHWYQGVALPRFCGFFTVGIARDQRGLKELPGSRCEGDVSDGHSDMSIDLEDITIPDIFFQTSPTRDISGSDN